MDDDVFTLDMIDEAVRKARCIDPARKVPQAYIFCHELALPEWEKWREEMGLQEQIELVVVDYIPET